MRVKVKATGDAYGTRVMTPDGRDIGGVQSVSYRHVAGEVPELQVRLSLVGVEIRGEARCVGPTGKEIRRIEYADGSVDDYSVGEREGAFS